MNPTEPTSLAYFAPHVGAAFAVELEGEERLDLVLLEASELEGERREGSREGFSLLFHAPSAEQLPQRTYTVHHPEAGAMTLFLVPVGLREGGVLLEAVFN